jgi:ribosomal protein L4
MNTYDIVHADVVLMTEGSVKAILEDFKELTSH